MSNFIEDCLNGKATEEQLDDYIEKWHTEEIGNESLREYLGMTEEQYTDVLLYGWSVCPVVKEKAMERIEQLVDLLNKASKAYYNESMEIMSNYEYDKLYDELLNLESRYDYSPENSPTRNVGYVIESDLKKETHEFKALSLDKTKDRNDLANWLNKRPGFLGWKLDGLTVQMTFDGGKLNKAVTRGNGEVGENVTHNAKYFKGVPAEIPFQGHLVIRGEALITYSQYEKINRALQEGNKYKNPRNLASGSVRQLDSKESARRHIVFKVFELVYAEDEPYLGADGSDTQENRYDWLSKQGFDLVESYLVDEHTILETIEKMEKQMPNNDFPSDGLVLSYNDIAYGKSLGTTGKFPKHSIAFKWKDETQETTLSYIEWSASRTGLINPVAVFKPVELEGTTVSRASVHNVSVLESLKLGEGDHIMVYKANMIIPQIAENLTQSETVKIPDVCPVCGANTMIKETTNNGQLIKTLHCTNPNCQAKHIKKFTHFVERDRMNISGLSEATLEKLIGSGLIKEFRDIYHLSEHKDTIITMEGFGEKSYEKLTKSIEKSKTVKLENLIAALGIDNVGRDAGKKISKALNGDLDQFIEKLESGNFLDVEDVGELSNNAINNWYQKQKDLKDSGESEFFNLLKEIVVKKPDIVKGNKDENLKLDGKVFVITGKLTTYGKRDDLVKKIESLGGKVTGSVSNKTHYLINNDTTSNSSKNKKAKELSIPILSEEDFNKLIEK